MYLQKILMTNFRCFEQADVEFEFERQEFERHSSANVCGAQPSNNVNLLLGNNGAGKTTILKAICLSILSPVIQQSGYRPYFLRRRVADQVVDEATMIQATLELHEQQDPARKKWDIDFAKATIVSEGSYEKFAINLRRNPPEITDDNSPAFFLAAYGATRRVERAENLDTQWRKRRGLRYQRVAGLFEDYIALRPIETWLAEVLTRSKERHSEIVELIRVLLPKNTRFTGDIVEDQAVFDHGGVRLPFENLSDGYRAYIGLVCDLLYHMQLVCPIETRLTDMTGVVLVDDIDLHLHPAWQRTVVPDLAKTFPKLQFILTSHSPLVAGTLHARNVRVVEDRKVQQFDERLHGMSADQILTSPYFGLSSSRSAVAEKKLASIANEIATEGPKGRVKAAMEYLSALSGTEESAT